MNIFKRAIETYDNYEKIGIVGEYGIAETLFAPKYHVDKSGDTIEVSISMSGEFIDAKVEKQAFIIPVTLLSEFRTSNNEANPFSDELQYVAPLKKGEAQAREEKHEKYMNELKEWALSPHAPEKVQAVYKYMEKETLCDDLVTKKDFSALGSTNKLVSKYKKYYVLWRVVINPQNESNKENYISECWKDKNLFKQYIEYYSGKLDREYEKEYFTDGKYSKKSPLCMITGERKIPAIKHKKISGSLGLISSNDTENFTYLGRFTDDKQALSIGYEASQKAHNALRWIYNNFQQTIDVDASTKFVSKMICWSPQPKEIDEDDYRHAVLKKPATMRAAEIRNEFDVLDEIVIAIMSQTSKGRFALVYYNDLNAYEYANRIENWDKWCSWNYRDCGIQNPSLEMIVRCAMGSEKQSDDNKVTKERFSINSKILKNERFHLLQCRLDGRKMPYHIVRNLYENASNPLNYSKEVLDYLGYVACAVIRKYRYDYFKEEWSVQLDMECKNRNYLWGRMLALLEKAEKDTYSEGEGRVPYAIQHQMAFSKKPYSEFKNIQEHWRNAYYGKLKYSSREFYDKAMTEIMVKLYEYPENEWNKPLDETYLMGYYCQRKELYTKKEEKKMEKKTLESKKNEDVNGLEDNQPVEVLKNKIDFLALVSVTNANPNGDPMNANKPRVDYDDYGEMSAYSIKRKIRNRMSDLGEKVFVLSQEKKQLTYTGEPDRFSSLNERFRNFAKSDMYKKALEDKTPESALCTEWLDVRTFGQVFGFKALEKDDKKVSMGVRGPVSIHHVTSVDPVEITSLSITKCVNGEPSDNIEGNAKSSDTMGTKHFVRFGLYVVKGSINVQLARKTGFTEHDAKILKECIRTMFENDVSDARPDGSMIVEKLYWFEHSNELGQYSSAKVHRSIKIGHKDGIDKPTCFDDYEITVEKLDGLEPEIIDGL